MSLIVYEGSIKVIGHFFSRVWIDILRKANEEDRTGYTENQN